MNPPLSWHCPGVAVLMFHGLCERVPEYVVSPGHRSCLLEVEDFSKLVEWCCKRFQIVRLEEIEEYLVPGSPGHPGMVLTFDDGLASVIDFALPVLVEYQVSAAVFVTTDWVNSACSPIIFGLERVLWKRIPKKIEIRANGKEFDLSVTSREELPKVLTRLWDLLFEMRIPPLELSSDDILIDGQPLEVSDAVDDRHFWYPSSWEELRSAAKSGIVEIGSHMVSHVPLPWLSDEEKLFQLNHSREELSNAIDVPITACSYPHGLTDENTISMAKKAYDWGFTIKPGQVHQKTPRNLAPRYHVPGESPLQICKVLKQDFLSSDND